jgi:hypothetical protein
MFEVLRRPTESAFFTALHCSKQHSAGRPVGPVLGQGTLEKYSHHHSSADGEGVRRMRAAKRPRLAADGHDRLALGELMTAVSQRLPTTRRIRHLWSTS